MFVFVSNSFLFWLNPLRLLSARKYWKKYSKNVKKNAEKNIEKNVQENIKNWWELKGNKEEIKRRKDKKIGEKCE